MQVQQRVTCTVLTIISINILVFFFFIFFCGLRVGMAAARQGARPANGAAAEMIVEAQELDESMRGADGVAGDVQGALCEAVGVRPTQCAQWVHCAPNGAKPQECDRDGRWSFAG